MLKRISCIFLAALLLFSISACSGKEQKSKEAMAFLEELYGEDTIVELPDGEGWARKSLVFLSDPQELELIPLDAYDTHRIDQEWGDANDISVSLEPAKEQFSQGEEIIANLINNGNAPIIYGTTYYLEMLIDGKWFSISPTMSFGAVAHITEAGELAPRTVPHTVGGVSSVISKLTYSEASQLYEAAFPDERDNDTPLMPGRYRYGIRVSSNEKYYGVYCEFDIVK